MHDRPNYLSLEAGAVSSAIGIPRQPGAVVGASAPGGEPAGLDPETAELDRLRDLLDRWTVIHLRVRAIAGETIDVPFPGSLLRGAFGAALRETACVRKGQPCGGCSLVDRCPYPAIFDDPRGPEPASVEPAGGRGSPVRPLALVPPAAIAAGPVAFDLKLFGLPASPTSPTAALPAVVAALLEMGRSGIGRDRVALAVERIEGLGPEGEASTVHDGRGFFPDGPRPFPASRLLGPGGPAGPAAPGDPVPRRLTVALRTPLRMKESGKLQSSLPPERLVRASLRRLTDLGEALGQEWPRAWPGILGAAARSVLLREDLRWFDWGRYSLRQGRPMRLGGALGTLEIEVPAALVGLLRAAAFAGLGKNTTFGLGAVEIREAM
jgi:hypothetical protein